uniref:C-type lectin domain-containing protein n=1 Tax=Kryptolebias marmoratus TaxID=37003 RepID=A0A3Q3AN93_KRYMA
LHATLLSDLNLFFLFFISLSELRCSGPDWYEFGDFCYKPFGDKKTWHDARRMCRNLGGGNLASIDMSYDQAFVAGAVLQGKADAWIGLRRKDGSYAWSDSWPVFFTQWGPGEPSNVKDEGCVSMHDGHWNDNNCLLKKGFACRHRQCKALSRPFLQL